MKAGCFQPDDFTANKLWRCYHSGDLGDIIYSLLFCKRLGNIHLMLGPDSRVKVREPMTQKRFDWLRPLLDVQPWIKSVEFVPSRPLNLDYNLNDFRHTWFSPRSGHAQKKRLFEVYFEHFRYPPPDETQPWLEVEPRPDSERPVIVSRSPRFHSPFFNWQAVSNRYAGRMRFIGHEQEFKDWSKAFGDTAVLEPVSDALGMAQYIAGAELFIGNQSFPMSLALALNIPVLQEVCEVTPDCIFHRSNAQYSNRGPIVLPPLKSTMRPVTNIKNREGLYELGPCADAFGLGDTLTITPVAKALGNKAVMIMPKAIEHMAFLFKGLCNVRIDENYPVFPWRHEPVVPSKLARFGLTGVEPIPVVQLDPALVTRVRPILDGIPSPLAFNPTCSKTWSHMRQRPAPFWERIVRELSSRFTICQFGRTDFPLIDGARRMPWVNLEELAALYSIIGNYCGVHTGDHHLMLAVGGRCVVAEPDPVPEFHTELWSYNSPRIQYGKLSNPNTVLEAIKRLPL